MDNMEGKHTLWNRIRKKDRQTLTEEEKDLQDRQEALRCRRDVLEDRQRDLREVIHVLMEDPKKNEIPIEITKRELAEIKADLDAVSAEYKLNSESLELYSKVAKNKDEGLSTVIGTLFSIAGAAGGFFLGKRSLDNAYRAEINGDLVNKKSLDIFNKLNPMRLIDHLNRK